MDGVALEGVYRENAAALEHKHPFTDEQLKAIVADATWQEREASGSTFLSL